MDAISAGGQQFIRRMVAKLRNESYQLEGGLKEKFEIKKMPDATGQHIEFLLVPQQFLVNVGKPFDVVGSFVK
jgi:hypothetical protein